MALFNVPFFGFMRHHDFTCHIIGVVFQTPQGNVYRGLIPNPELVVMACHVAPSETPLSLCVPRSLTNIDPVLIFNVASRLID